MQTHFVLEEEVVKRASGVTVVFQVMLSFLLDFISHHFCPNRFFHFKLFLNKQGADIKTIWHSIATNSALLYSADTMHCMSNIKCIDVHPDNIENQSLSISPPPHYLASISENWEEGLSKQRRDFLLHIMPRGRFIMKTFGIRLIH